LISFFSDSVYINTCDMYNVESQKVLKIGKVRVKKKHLCDEIKHLCDEIKHLCDDKKNIYVMK